MYFASKISLLSVDPVLNSPKLLAASISVFLAKFGRLEFNFLSGGTPLAGGFDFPSGGYNLKNIFVTFI